MTQPFHPTSPAQAHKFLDAKEAVACLRQIYETNTAFLRNAFYQLAKDGASSLSTGHIRAHYPYAAITTTRTAQIDTRLSFGFVRDPGRYSTTVTRPDLFENYYRHQFELLLKSHSEPIEIGVSTTPIPIHFAFSDGMYVEGNLDNERVNLLRQVFDLPDLALIDDKIANGTYVPEPGFDSPLSLFTAPRVDYSLNRLRHYTNTDCDHFQNFVIFTNYQFYVDEFIKLAQSHLQDDSNDKIPYDALVEPGEYITYHKRLNKTPVGERAARLPQMPAYHLKRDNHSGITLINIGVGPSNARTISDHVAVIRPNAWIMLGHCAGLRDTQKLGDYVLAHGYVRDDHVLDDELPLWVPVPSLAEIQHALEGAVESITGLTGYDLKSVMRTGTVVTTGNRNWEVNGYTGLVERFNQSRAIALDMESAVIAANGFRYRVPYGTLLCVSDRPLHGEIKLPGMANSFYRQQINQHLHIGVRTMELLRDTRYETLHSRKLRGFADTAFQ